MKTRSQTLTVGTNEKSNNNTQTLINRFKVLEQINQNMAKEIACLRTENDMYKTCVKLNQNSLSSKSKANNESKWLDDCHIIKIFENFSYQANKMRKDIIFVQPNITQLLKSESLYEILDALTSINFDDANIAFFAINDYNQCNEKTVFGDEFSIQGINDSKGAHWSLLILSKKEKTFYHLDSIRGANYTQAKIVANNVNCEYDFKEIDSEQQSSNFECGIHLLVNAKFVLKYILSETLNSTYNLNNFLFDKIFHNVELYCIVFFIVLYF